MRFSFLLPLIAAYLISSLSAAGEHSSLTFSGQLSGWMDLTDGTFTNEQLGLRYIPELFIKKELNQQMNWDLLTSLNTMVNGYFRDYEDLQNTDFNNEIELYRAWMRFSGNQFEIRVGLQKINFGAASILRPLMWFDSVDPRDPMDITKGVKALLIRYYFLNNINVWFWGLYGNEDLKGWELLPTKKDIPELGSRLQIPIFAGEAAVTYHMRTVDLENTLFAMFPFAEKQFNEYRYGLDGKWDYVLGFWFETSLIHQDYDLLPLPWQHTLNFGADYTFDLGNGLNLVFEHFISEYSDAVFKPGQGIRLSALSFNYPLGLLDRISTITYYAWDDEQAYYFLNWQRKYDKLSIAIMGYWNPDEGQIYMNQDAATAFKGKGGRIMISFNH